MAIDLRKIRAEVVVGSIRAITPYANSSAYILSFNVERNRGQISSFSCSLKVQSGSVTGKITNGTVEIFAGVEGDVEKIFTGLVRNASISPCREDPGYVILNLSGNDILSRLQGKKFTRRCRSTKGVWVGIEGVARPGLRSGKLTFVPREPNVTTTGGELNRQSNLVMARSNVAELHKAHVAKPPVDEVTPSINIEVTPYDTNKQSGV